AAQDLKLVPEPKQVQKREGAFTITPKTRIVVNAAYADEDRTAAETLAEEIQAAIGQKLKITTSRSLPKSGAIYLVRVGDDKRLQSTLESSDLSIDDKFDAEGYVLDAGNQRVIVASRTGAGLFYGAQTLRQLVHRGPGKDASGPAVSIK